ncbi:MAG: hypothetical protein C5B50_29485 [Verrucomicrobia bacterium]|nr:MAG: hypothetical protein C5B50_29485 [Verrucomicrobiota bacterium]
MIGDHFFGFRVLNPWAWSLLAKRSGEVNARHEPFRRAVVLASILRLAPVLLSTSSALAAPLTNTFFKLPPHLPLNRISSGLLMLLNHGDLVQWPTNTGSTAYAHRSTDPSIVAGLDPRVGLNLQLGPDPSSLPSNQRAQAEPHIVRDPLNPDTLVATFQEGRYTSDGGAIDCGYSVTHDGGLSWTRALIPLLTQVAGGPYYRATDPVAGIDLSGNIYLNTLGALDSLFDFGSVVISRSTNGGVTFDAPVEIFRQTSSSLSPDKNWMAINTFSGTPFAGRIVVTWTMFTAASPIARSYSDDGGRTWSGYSYATPSSYSCQGSQPLFMRDGTLAIPYWNFASSFAGGGEAIEIVTSTNGGATFSSPRLVAAATEYDAPNMRQGSFLPSAATDRTNGVLGVVYQTTYQGSPRVMFTRSSDKGVTWTAPKPVSDNPGTPLFNPALSFSPDGQTVTVIFYDERVHPAQNALVDIFMAQSFDGGATWQPNLRLTTVSSDVTLAPLTSSGYMLGDYQAVAPPNSPNLPAVPVWIDTRTGNPDPFITRVGIAPQITFAGWRAARFNTAQIANPAIGGPGADPDNDGVVNALEYAFGLNPWQNDAPASSFQLTGSGASTMLNTTYERLGTASDLTYSWLSSFDLVNWTTAYPSNVVITSNSPRLTQNVTSSFGPATNAARFYRLTVHLN